MRAAVTISLVPEARGGPFVFWDDLTGGFRQAAEAGFDAVELFLPGANSVPLGTIQELTRRHSLPVAAVGTGAGWVKHKWRLTDADPAVRAQALNFCLGMVNFAGILGAPAIIGSMQGRWEGAVTRELALDWLGEGLSQLGDRASAHGTTLLYEPLNRYETNLLNRLGDSATFLETRGIRHVKVLADLFHMNIEEPDMASALRENAGRVGHIHWADSNRQAMGWGHTDAGSVAAVLRETGYDGYLSAEILSMPDAESAAKQTITSVRHWFPAS